MRSWSGGEDLPSTSPKMPSHIQSWLTESQPLHLIGCKNVIASSSHHSNATSRFGDSCGESWSGRISSFRSSMRGTPFDSGVRIWRLTCRMSRVPRARLGQEEE